MKKCPKCGTANREDSRFCERCGTDLAEAPKPEPAKSDSPLICPNCNTPNRSDDAYCKRCGSALPKRSKPRTAAARPVQAATNRTQKPANQSIMPTTSKNKKKTGLYAGIGIAAVFVAAVLIGVFVFGRNSNASTENPSAQTVAVNKDFENKQEDRKSEKEESSKPIHSDREDPAENVAREDEPASSPIDSTPDDVYEKSSSSETKLPIAHITREKSNYSGPAAAQIILESKGIISSQEEIANGIMINGVSDFERLAGYLTHAFDVNGISAQYTGVYMDLSQLTVAQEDALFNSIDTNLSTGYPTIVCVNFQTGQPSTYGLICGSKSDNAGSTIYTLYIPDEAGHTYDVTKDDLIQLMTGTGFFCYLY